MKLVATLALTLLLTACSPSAIVDNVIGGIDPIVWWITGGLLAAAGFLALRAAGVPFTVALGLVTTAVAALGAGIVHTRGRKAGRDAARREQEKIDNAQVKKRDKIARNAGAAGGDANRDWLRKNRR